MQYWGITFQVNAHMECFIGDVDQHNKVNALGLVLVAWSNLEYFHSSMNGMLAHHWYTYKHLGGEGYCESNKKCLAQEHNTVIPAKLEPGLFDSESSTSTIMSLHLLTLISIHVNARVTNV